MLKTIYKKYTRESYSYFSHLAKKKSFWRKQRFQIWKAVSVRRLYRIVKSERYPESLSPVEDGLIVSLTSFPGRIDNAWFTIESMLRQSIRPAKILLYLSKAEFENEGKELPDFLENYKRYGLEVVWVDVNLRSHNKYFYALKTYREQIIVTVDDDLYYPSDTLSRLLRLHEQYPEAICANITRKINQDAFMDYSKWDKNPGHRQYNESHSLVAMGYGSVLYPKTFRPDCLFDVEGIKDCAFYADDLWLKAVEMFVGVPVVTGEYFAPPLTTPASQHFALQKKNCGIGNRNNIQWEKLTTKFNLTNLA